MRAARLLLINGLPGSGKSTLARRYVVDHPLSLRLDIDEVRGFIGAWKERFDEAAPLARKLALAMARVALRDGHDVIVPQFLGRLAFIEEMQALADEVGIPFVEVALFEDVVRARARLEARAAGPMNETQRDAHDLLARAGGLDGLPELHARLLKVLNARASTRVLTPIVGDVQRTYRDLLVLISSHA